uniref:Regulation of nuclear pre-mRNA domain-containing protein n=1 Tax=Bos indicus x Bos taurus TaxID=30522 RepID=A0A4W2BPL6_BOBOX
EFPPLGRAWLRGGASVSRDVTAGWTPSCWFAAGVGCGGSGGEGVGKGGVRRRGRGGGGESLLRSASPRGTAQTRCRRDVRFLRGGAGEEAVGVEQLAAERADLVPVAHPPSQALATHRHRVGAGAAESETDESCKKHLGRVLSIWEERSVYENDVLEQLKQALYGDKKPRKRTYEQIKVDENENCSSLGSPSEPPQTLDLVRALQDLENAASGDAAVHQRIASLPVEVQEVSLLDKITDKESGERLSKMVEDACMLLADYNGRLAAEIDDRKQLTRMLADFLRCQKEALAEKEHKLEVLDMGVSSNDVINLSIFFLLKINIKLQSLNCLMFLKIED